MVVGDSVGDQTAHTVEVRKGAHSSLLESPMWRLARHIRHSRLLEAPMWRLARHIYRSSRAVTADAYAGVTAKPERWP